MHLNSCGVLSLFLSMANHFVILCCRACMATMGILYYRLAQRGLGEEFPDDEQR